jgi:hypothetical protein
VSPKPLVASRPPRATERKGHRIVGADEVPQIFAGDLIRAIRGLNVHTKDEDTMLRIANVLGLRAPAPRPMLQPNSTTAGAAVASAAGSSATPAAEPESVGGVARDDTVLSTPTKVRDAPATRPKVPWFDAVESLPAPSRTASRPALEPLFIPRWTRAIVSASLSVRTADGPLDIDRIVARIARALPLLGLPRQPWPTVRLGVQLLVDTSDGMLPYIRDIDQLTAAVRRVIGRDRIEILAFDSMPTRGAGGGLRSTWTKSYQPPVRPRPVAVVTDLGLGRPESSGDRGTTGEWLTFVDEARRAGCPVVAFVPYPLARIPVALLRGAAVISWDRSTSIRDVHRRIGRGLDVVT